MPEIKVPVFGRFVVADPDKRATRVEYARLSEVLTQDRHTDVFFTQYSNPEHPYRLSQQGVTPPRMVLAVFDVDDPGEVEKKARPEWLTAERYKIARLVNVEGAFVYQTRGGYRVVAELPEPFAIREPKDAAAWTAFYKTWCNYLERVYGIEADRACADWPRLFRLPHATRDRGGKPERLPTYGTAHDPGIWCPKIQDSDRVPPEEVSERLLSELSTDDDTHACPLGLRVAHALEYAETLPPAVSRQGGHNTLLVAASVIYRGFALPRDHALSILEDAYNPRCEPPWTSKELNHKLSAVERSSERWGEEIDAILLAQALEAWHPRPQPKEPKEPKDAEEDDEPVQLATTSVTSGQAVEPATPPKEWIGNAGDCADYFRTVGDPLLTGIETIDRITDGGFRRGEPVVIGGAPDTGKTTVVASIALKWARELGLKVAWVAADEPAPRIKARVGQALGLARRTIYKGAITEAERAGMNAIPIRIYDGYEEKVTIEAVAKRLADYGPGVLVIDSLQTARSIRVTDRMQETQAYTQVALSIRDIAQRYQHLVLVTSELTKEFYRNHEQALDLDPMAAFAGSRSIAHMAVFGLVLLQPPNPAEHVLARVAKNKTLGTGRADFAIKFDHAHATAYEVPLPSPDRDESDAFDDATPRIDLKRAIWNTVREKRCESKEAIVVVAKENGIYGTPEAFKRAIVLLVSENLIYKAEDGHFMTNPWPALL